MSIVRTQEDLPVWKAAIALAGKIYSVTHSMSADLTAAEPDALPARMRRSAESIASHIAEGAACGNRMEYIRFLDLARGALSALETQTCIGLELGLIERGTRIDAQVADLGQLLDGLRRRLREHRERARGFEPPHPPGR